MNKAHMVLDLLILISLLAILVLTIVGGSHIITQLTT